MYLPVTCSFVSLAAGSPRKSLSFLPQHYSAIEMCFYKSFGQTLYPIVTLITNVLLIHFPSSILSAQTFKYIQISIEFCGLCILWLHIVILSKRIYGLEISTSTNNTVCKLFRKSIYFAHHLKHSHWSYILGKIHVLTHWWGKCFTFTVGRLNVFITFLKEPFLLVSQTSGLPKLYIISPYQFPLDHCSCNLSTIVQETFYELNLPL